MSISKRKLAANRANAQKSSGPTTAAGLARSSQNRIVHGLCGKFNVLESENQEDYNNLFERFLTSEQPVDDVERELVAKMCSHTWMSERSVRFQDACFQHRPFTGDQRANDKQTIAVLKDLNLYLRYQAANDRAYQRAAAELAKRRKDRAWERRGFESQKRAEAAQQYREKRQDQSDQMFKVRHAIAEVKLERDQINLLKEFDGFGPPQSGKMAA